jgi:hypothetical protein
MKESVEVYGGKDNLIFNKFNKYNMEQLYTRFVKIISTQMPGKRLADD